MTRKVFWEDPYQTELQTTVTCVDGNDVQVAETIFYALSGGQESDQGTIGQYPVQQARWVDRNIVYTLQEGHGLTPDMPVTMVIDWPRRYQLMRLHFAAELILEIKNPVHRLQLPEPSELLVIWAAFVELFGDGAFLELRLDRLAGDADLKRREVVVFRKYWFVRHRDVFNVRDRCKNMYATFFFQIRSVPVCNTSGLIASTS